MAATLVIKNADFSTNKLDTVALGTIPCTGISLEESTASVVYGGSYTAVATVTPANTTDEVVWTSNNENFPVVDGVVSINGVGQAVITATCGEQTASVTIISTATFDSDDYDVASNMRLKFTSDYCSLDDSYATNEGVIGRVSETGYHTLWTNQATKAVGQTFCPAIIPIGSTHMTISYNASYGQKACFADMNTQASAGNGAVEIITHDDSDVLIAERTLTIPSNANGYYISFRRVAEQYTITFT